MHPKTKNFDDLLEADIIVNYINTRNKKGLGTTIYVIGLSGTGKSSTCQRCAELITQSRPDENLETFIVDSLLKLLEAIQKAKKGDIIIIEEISVLFPSRRAMGKENVAIGKVLDTIRKRELCIFSNAPIWLSIDSHMRAMGHLIIQTLNVDKKQEVVVSKFFRLQTNPSSGKTYFHTMQRKGRDVSLMFTKMPDLEKWDEYERQKDKLMDDLYNKLRFAEEKKDNKIEKEMEKPLKHFKEINSEQLKRMRLLVKHPRKDVSKMINRSVGSIGDMMKTVLKRGWILSDFEEGGNYDMFLKRNEP